MSEIFRTDRIRRFFKVAREEGWRAAFSKVRMFLRLRIAGYAPSILGAGGAQSPSQSAFYLAPFWLEAAEQGAFHVSSSPALVTKRRKIAMIGDLNLPQCRKYRVEQPDEIWQLAGVDYVYSHYQDIPRCVSILQDATHVMFYRLQSGPLTSMYAYEARRLRLPILYDLDDPLFSISAYGTYDNMKALPPSMKAHFLSEAPKYLDTMMMADLVSVSTPGMRDHTALYLPTPVHYRRNFADRATLENGLSAQKEARNLQGAQSGFRVAFASGSQGHEVDFGVIQDDLNAFLEADKTRKLVILGHFDKALLPAASPGQIETHPFSGYADYLKTLATVDCAVMPLTDDIFNRCKSGVRVIDASAVSVPSLVGHVSDMANMVRDGATGRVLGPEDSWHDALETLARERGAARSMGAEARKLLEAEWSARTEPPVLDREILQWVRG
ncbi:hypothetical protein ACEWPM_018360 [Roseovarius sp. S4756]|uniref:hypothetical protein n=1 Tax=Roseovarius maritimus TaxID=3342637 RepID=UPI00372852B7